MNKALLLSFLCLSLFLSDKAQSQTMKMSIGGTSEYKEDKVKLYNFSDELLQATANCSPYSEDFSKNNSTISFFGMSPKITINILGKDNGLCKFVVKHEFKGMGGSQYTCQINAQQQKELLEAMKDRSTELITETYTSYTTIESGDEVQRIPYETKITAGRFIVEYSKITGSSCEIEEITYSEEEKEQTKKDMLSFSHEFINSLRKCEPDTEEFSMFILSKKAEIIGMQDDNCYIKYSDFDLFVPTNIIPNITGFDSLETLLKNRDIAKYNKKLEYSYNGLLFEIDHCAKHHEDHRGESTTQSSEFVSIKRGISTEYINQTCVIKLQNELEIDGSIEDYSIRCPIPEKEIQHIADTYSELISKYGEKREYIDGGVRFISAQKNAETKQADDEIMYYLQQKGFCQ